MSRRTAALLLGCVALVLAVVAVRRVRGSDTAEVAFTETSGMLFFDPSWSPREDRIAFAAGRGQERFGIFVVPVRGGTARRLTPPDIDAGGAPAWDPLGRRLVFTTGTNDLAPSSPRELYVVEGNGRALKRLTRNNRDDTMATWSPRGETIAFVRGRKEDYDLHITQPRRRTATRAVTMGLVSDRFPSWSPDGRTLAFVRDDESIYALTLPEGRARLLVATGTTTEYTAYSPKAETLAYWADGLWLRDVRGRTKRIGWEGLTLLSPLWWSPDGRQIAFQVGESVYGPATIWVVHARSGRRLRLGQGAGGMSWSPDSTRLVFAPFGFDELHVIEVDRLSKRHRIPVRFRPDGKIRNR